MADIKEARVPDIGDFTDVPVIEVLVSVGDKVEKDQGLVTLESDKATMEVPAPFAGVVKELKVKEGDALTEGDVVALIEAAGDDGKSDEKKPDEKKAEDRKRAKSGGEESEGEPKKEEAKKAGGKPEVKEARVPDIGDFTDVPVIEVLVSVGDKIEKDQGLVTLESDKATMEVPAPFAGVVKELKVKEGDALTEGDVVALIEAAGDDGKSDEKKAGDKKSEPKKEEAKKDEGKREEKPARPEQPQPAADLGGRSELDPEAAPPRTPPVDFGADALMPDKVPYASPAVRVFARELGVDLSRVKGTARGGRIGKEDVQAYVKSVMQGDTRTAPVAASAGGGLNLLPWPKVDFAKFGQIESKPLSRIKKISGANLARNWAMIPHVTQQDLADITEMEAFRKKLGEENKDTKVTPLVFLIKAAVAALKKFPQFNASLDASGENLVLKKYFHIGIAVDTPDGLVVPVIRDCDSKGLIELASELGEMSKKARDKKLGPADMSGGCFSISSLGGIGGTGFTPIINAPEVAILGVSRSSTQPVWNGKEFAPRLMLPLSLSYDHRVIDGADAARFTAYLAQVLGDLRRLLL